MMLLLLSLPCLAATLVVDPSDSAAHATVQAAVEAASSGDTITLSAHTFTECIDTDGMDLTFVGAGEAATRLEGATDCANVLSVQSGETVAVSDLTISNPGARGIYVYGSTLSLEQVALVDSGNETLAGGGLYADESIVSLTRCELSGNTASEGGGAYLYYAVTYTDSGSTYADNIATTGWGGGLNAYWSHTVSLTDSVFERNQARDSSGGALASSWYSTLAVEGASFVDNSAGNSGGAVMNYVLSGTTVFRDSTFTGNTAADYGGAIEHEWYASLWLDGSSFSQNEAGADGGAVGLWYDASMSVRASAFEGNSSLGGVGGAINFQPEQGGPHSLDVRETTFEDNTAAVHGGAIYGDFSGEVSILESAFDRNHAGVEGTGGGLLIYVADAVSVLRTRFCGNSAQVGGGMSLQWIGVDSVMNSVFVNNTAERGGGLHRYVSYTAVANHNSFVGNTASDWGGSYYADWAYSDFRNNLVAHSSFDAIVARTSGSASNSTLSHDAWWSNLEVDAAGYFYLDPDHAHVTTDPRLAAWSADGDCADHSLRGLAGSALADAGDPALGDDPDGSLPDIGAYGGPDAPVEDHDGDGFDSTEDCLDGDASVHPGADEWCDGVDTDCDGTRDEADALDAETWFADVDGDGVGDDSVRELGCGGEGWVRRPGDCDDTDPMVHPDMEDRWYDGVDSNCDGAADFDADGDGVDKPVGDNGGTDCDDTDPTIYPGAEDTPGDGIDQDCTGTDAELIDAVEDPVDTEPADDPKTGGCATVSSAASAWAVLLSAVGLVRRRSTVGQESRLECSPSRDVTA